MVEHGLTVRDPSDIAGPQIAQRDLVTVRILFGTERLLDRAHGLHHARTLGRGHARKHRADVVTLPLLPARKVAPSFGRERQLRASSVRARRLASYKAASLERR